MPIKKTTIKKIIFTITATGKTVCTMGLTAAVHPSGKTKVRGNI